MSVLFPKWTNFLPTVAALGAVGGLVTAVAGAWYYLTPDFYKVGYMPTQPGGGFNHQLHAGKLGMDCRYCHTKVEKSYEANIPNVATCYGCHSDNKLALLSTSETHKTRTAFIREAYAKDESIPWRRVHKVPDYVHNFPHHAHLNAGISCYSCHGQITAMPVVYQAKGLGMGFCLECHRNPEKYVVPKDKLTQLQWVEANLTQRAEGVKDPAVNVDALLSNLEKRPPQNCGACHY